MAHLNYLLLTSSKRKSHYFFLKTFRDDFNSDIILLDFHDHACPELGAFSVRDLFLLVWFSGWLLGPVFKEPTTYTLAAQRACLSLDCAAVGWLERKAAGVGQVFPQVQGDGCRPHFWTGAVSGMQGSGHGGGFASPGTEQALGHSCFDQEKEVGKLCFLLGARQKLGRRLSCELSLPCWLVDLLPPSPVYLSNTGLHPGIWDCGTVCLITFLDIFIIYHQLTLLG